MTHLPRPTLRALRSVVARALGVRRSRVRVTERPYGYPHASDHREVVVRTVGPARDWWSAVHAPRLDGRRWATRYITRRVWSSDLP